MQEQTSDYASRKTLNLELLFSDLPVMTDWYAEECYSALLICLEYHNHKSGTETDLHNLNETLVMLEMVKLELVWTKHIEDDDRRIWGGPSNAAERAGEGMAWLIIHEFTDYTVINRSLKKTGVDFWLGYKEDAEKLVFQEKARVEAKGRTELKSYSKINRVLEKAVEQTEQSDSTNLPAYIVLTEFSRPEIYLVEK